MKFIILILAICFMISCNTDRERVESMVESLVPIVNKNFNPPLCFLGNAYYGYNGGPVLVPVSCDSIESAANKVVVGSKSQCERE